MHYDRDQIRSLIRGAFEAVGREPVTFAHFTRGLYGMEALQKPSERARRGARVLWDHGLRSGWILWAGRVRGCNVYRLGDGGDGG